MLRSGLLVSALNMLIVISGFRCGYLLSVGNMHRFQPSLMKAAVHPPHIINARRFLNMCTSDGIPPLQYSEEIICPPSLNQRQGDGTAFAYLVPSGVCPVYKPQGWSSNDVVQKIKGILQREAKFRTANKKVIVKVGHGGTLDPLAEGVLVLGIGGGTKLLGEYLKGTKGYLAQGKLGVEMDSLDSTGNQLRELPWEHVDSGALRGALANFRGDILQLPPMHSALKKDGEKLYELARKGITVEREPRPVTVYRLEESPAFCTNEKPDASAGGGAEQRSVHTLSIPMSLPNFALEVECSGGFYVRTLIADLAESLGTVGHMTGLVRTKQGQFSVGDCLFQGEWDAAAIIKHTELSSAKVGIPAEKMKNAITVSEKPRRRSRR